MWVTFVQRLYCTYAVIRLFYCFWFCLDTIQFNPIQFNSPVYSDRSVPYKNTHKIQKYTRIKNWISQPFCLLNAMQHTYTMKHIKVSKVRMNWIIVPISSPSKFGTGHCCSLILIYDASKAAWLLSSSVYYPVSQLTTYLQIFYSLTSVNYKSEHSKPAS